LVRETFQLGWCGYRLRITSQTSYSPECNTSYTRETYLDM
jgi:hypothetical protein